LVPLDSQFFPRLFDHRRKSYAQLLLHGPHRTDAARTEFMTGSFGLALNLRAFSIRDESKPIDGQDGSARVTVAHDRACSCHRLFSDADVIFDCPG